MQLCMMSRRLKPHADETRRSIVSAIQSHAGLRYSELARMTKLAHGTLSHHIKILERYGLIRARRDCGYTRLFPESYDDELCRAISLTDHPTTIAIMTLLMRHEAGFSQIKDAVAKSASTIPVHLARLYSAGVITKKKADGLRIYALTDIDEAAMILNRGAMVVKA